MVPIDPSGLVSLTWHKFSTNLGTTSSLLRERNILTDITFIVEEKQVGLLLLLKPSTYFSLLKGASS